MRPGDRLTGLRTRHARELVEETLADTPITVIQGARQVGKSTLAREVVVGRDATVLSLDAAAAYGAARADPDAFVRQTDGLLVIDEVQRVPELVRAMKDAVEEDRRPGRFLVTGSADLLHIPGTEESLAGRAETVVLYGLSQGELAGHREDFVDRLLAGDERALSARVGTLSREEYLEAVCAGSFPEPLTRVGRRRSAWFDNYVKRITTRDAQSLSRLAHLDRLPDLLRLLAANTSGELVKARIAKDAGIPETSLPGYLDLLETLYLIQVLPAWGDNLTKRVTGRPKVALLDTGLAARLNHVTPAAMAPGAVSDAAGGLFESFVSGELRRQLVWAQTPARLFHFRDRDGREVDIVIESDGRRVAGVEMKAAGSVSQRDFKGLALLRDKLNDRFAMGVVLYTGRQPLPFGDRLWALPYSALWS
ncbi:ATP-binding protein [Nocardioides ferulae]|uniref:ATP-binding protein n=1 Tax=Nocardioides ferulae TaxID=2340821 RepID=UPI000EB1563F|nr:ATP-binding protein [Nocardioides ferulae]